MRLTVVFVIVLLVVAFLISRGESAPQSSKINMKLLKQGGKVIKEVLGTVSAGAGTYSAYEEVAKKIQTKTKSN